MRKSHFKDEFLVLFWPIISSFFAYLNEEKKSKQQKVRALVLSLWDDPIFVASTKVAKAGKIASLTTDIFADILALNFANINAALWRLDA
jgi:hypothetical protein